jgi:hypothetical protein
VGVPQPTNMCFWAAVRWNPPASDSMNSPHSFFSRSSFQPTYCVISESFWRVEEKVSFPVDYVW